MYVCPLGTFNFLYSTVSPTKISARSLDVCRTCVGHDCINGNAAQQGCQLELYVPTLRSNLDCTLCLDCVKACPHDNVALAVRPPAQELFDRTWPRRLDLALLAVLATFLALVNAFAMTPPAYVLEAEIAAVLGTQRAGDCAEADLSRGRSPVAAGAGLRCGRRQPAHGEWQRHLARRHLALCLRGLCRWALPSGWPTISSTSSPA
ncbi:MAG: hypothetical protein R2851_24925 [Caldilineaceae bacterium]